MDTLRGLRNGGDPLRRGDERARFDAGDILRIGPRQEAIVVFWQRDKDAGIDELKECNFVDKSHMRTGPISVTISCTVIT